MKPANPLHLYEEVLLLALKDEKGTIAGGSAYRIALGAAILAELMLSGRIAIEQEKKKQFARVVDDRPVGDEILDEALQRVRDHKKRQQLRTWAPRFGNAKDMLHRAAQGLCRKRVLRADQDKVLWVFKRRIYPELDPKPERAIVRRLEKAINGAAPVDPGTMTLVAIANATNLLGNVIDKKRLKERKERIQRITSGDAAGAAAKAAVDAARAAVAGSVVIGSVVTTG